MDIKKPFHLYYKFKTNNTCLLNTGYSNYLCEEFIKFLNKSFTIMTSITYDFPYGGHSGAIILGESHCTWHTFPENDYIVIDLYSCMPINDLLFKEDIIEKYNWNVLEESIQFR